MAKSAVPPASQREAAARADRMFDALKALELRERRGITLRELGERIATAEGRAEPYADSVVRRWFKGLSEPSTLALWRAIAAVLGESPSWLAFGEVARSSAAEPQSASSPAAFGAPLLTAEDLTRPAVRPPERAATRKPKAG